MSSVKEGAGLGAKCQSGGWEEKESVRGGLAKTAVWRSFLNSY